MKRVLMNALLIGVIFMPICAQADLILTLYSTGVANNGTLLSGGATDPHYTLIASADPAFPGPTAMVVYDNIYPFPAWWYANGPNSMWIAPSANESIINTPGLYTFRTTFDLTGFDLNSAVITGKWVSDNNGVNILINGISTGFTNSGWFYDASGFSTFTIGSGFVAGLNTLDFIVLNGPTGGSQNPIGLRVEMSGTASPVPIPPAIFLLGSGLTGLFYIRRRFKK